MIIIIYRFSQSLCICEVHTINMNYFHILKIQEIMKAKQESTAGGAHGSRPSRGAGLVQEATNKNEPFIWKDNDLYEVLHDINIQLYVLSLFCYEEDRRSLWSYIYIHMGRNQC